MPNPDPIAVAARLLRVEAKMSPFNYAGSDRVEHFMRELREAADALEEEGWRLRARIAKLEDALKPLADVGGYIKRYHSSPVYKDAGLWVPSSTAEPEPPRLMYRDAIKAHDVLEVSHAKS